MGKGLTSEPTANDTPAATCFLNSRILYSSISACAAAWTILRFAMLRKVLEDGKGGETVRIPFFHEADRLFTKLCGVVD